MSKTMFKEVVNEAIRIGASDIHMTEGVPPILRVDGQLMSFGGERPLESEQIGEIIKMLLDERQIKKLVDTKFSDFSFAFSKYRFRGHAYRQMGKNAVVFRLIPTDIPKIEDLNLPLATRKLIGFPNGLILVTGITGSGKSTTLASLVSEINETQSKHIITVEDPIEFIHTHKKCIVNQREVGTDVLSFSDAVKSAVREDPDVLLVGEMRDLETIQNTITMAETGHLVLATLHTRNASETVNRAIDVFSPEQQQQIRLQLSNVLQGILSQHLLPRPDGGRVPACELMLVNDSIRNLIREKAPPAALDDQMQMNHKKTGSQTFTQSYADLCRRQLITYDIAKANVTDEELLQRMVERA